MRHYHGTPLGGKRLDVAAFVRGRHFFIPFGSDEDLGAIADACRGFAFDNGAYSAWRKGTPITDWGPYYAWCREWSRHPRFDFAIIPDVIDGDEADNDLLVREWDKRMWHPVRVEGVPVWHLHESIDRLKAFCCDSRWHRVALGSSGQWSTPGTEKWRDRMHEAMVAICDEFGRPPVKLHGLRMLKRDVIIRYPLASADSTSVAQNKHFNGRLGMWRPPTVVQQMEIIAANLEGTVSPAAYCFDRDNQERLFAM